MADISTELAIISDAESGETVRSAIADASLALTTTIDVDITEELALIRSSRYGQDIRMAIHDALEKLSAYEPPPVVQSIPVGISELEFIGTDLSEIGIAETEE